MTYGPQPTNNGRNMPNSNPYAQQPYGQPYNPQYAQATASAPNAGAYQQTPINAMSQVTYERATHDAVTRTYGEMTIGLLITAAVAFITQMTGAYISFIRATGLIGILLVAGVQIGLAVYLGVRVMKMQASTARIWFYVFAALMGFTLSTIFMAYSLGTIGVALLVTAGFFFALTMFGMTTKGNMLKAGPVLLIGLIVLIVAEVIVMFIFPGDTAMMIITALGIVVFAGLTIYDTQFMKRVFAQYSSQGPEAIKRLSILCALNLYLDFINMFLYILRLFGSRD
ncbi:Bax inhibitor-1/YccA family protein [Bifidobacterium gallicum]|nr:Bax inhibitor-1/YccA family protein [Bifidobacterium gallicum]KFI59154.1 membrane protein [Bifidobacterium gallicum DSM 20093 = LMG 11596]